MNGAIETGAPNQLGRMNKPLTPFEKLRARREAIAELKAERFKHAKAIFSGQTPPPSPSATEDRSLSLSISDRWLSKLQSKQSDEYSPVKSNLTTSYHVVKSNNLNNTKNKGNTILSANDNINLPAETAKSIVPSHELNRSIDKPHSQLNNSHSKSTSICEIRPGKNIAQTESGVVVAAESSTFQIGLRRQHAVDLVEGSFITLRNTSEEHARCNNIKSTSEWSTFRHLNTKLSRITVAEASTAQYGISEMGKQKVKHTAAANAQTLEADLNDKPRTNNTKNVIDKFEHLTQETRIKGSKRTGDQPRTGRLQKSAHSDPHHKTQTQEVVFRRGRSENSARSSHRRSKSLTPAHIRSVNRYVTAETEIDTPKSTSSRRPPLYRTSSLDKYADEADDPPVIRQLKPILKRDSDISRADTRGRTTPKKKQTISFSESESDASDLWVKRNDVLRHDESVFRPTIKPRPQRSYSSSRIDTPPTVTISSPTPQTREINNIGVGHNSRRKHSMDDKTMQQSMNSSHTNNFMQKCIQENANKTQPANMLPNSGAGVYQIKPESTSEQSDTVSDLCAQINDHEFSTSFSIQHDDNHQSIHPNRNTEVGILDSEIFANDHLRTSSAERHQTTTKLHHQHGINKLDVNHNDKLLSVTSPQLSVVGGESSSKKDGKFCYREIWIGNLPDPDINRSDEPQPLPARLNSAASRVASQAYEEQDRSSTKTEITPESHKEQWTAPVIKSATSAHDLIDLSDDSSKPSKPELLFSLSQETSTSFLDMDSSVDFPPPPCDFQLTNLHTEEENPYEVIPYDRVDSLDVVKSGMGLSYTSKHTIDSNHEHKLSIKPQSLTTECSKRDNTNSSSMTALNNGDYQITQTQTNDHLQDSETDIKQTQNSTHVSDAAITHDLTQVGNKPSNTNEVIAAVDIHKSASIDDDVFVPAGQAEGTTKEAESIYHTIFLPPCSFSDDSQLDIASPSSEGDSGQAMLSQQANDCANKGEDNSVSRGDNKELIQVNTSANNSSLSETGDSLTLTQQNGNSYDCALQRVMRDVKTVSYWDSVSHSTSTDKFSDTDSLQSEIILPRGQNTEHLKTTTYAARFSASDTDTTTTSFEQLDAGSEDSSNSQSKKRVTIALKGEVAQKKKSLKNQPITQQQKSILKKPVSNPIYDTLSITSNGHQSDDTDSIHSDSVLMRRSYSTTNLSTDAPHIRVASEWYVPPPVQGKTSTLPHNSKLSYLDLPNKHKNKKSQSLDFIIESAYDTLSDCSSDTMNHRLNSKTQSLPRGVSRLTARHTQRRGSLTDRLSDRLTFGRLSKIFSKSKKSSAPITSNGRMSPMTTVTIEDCVTLDALYAEWLDGPAKSLPYSKGGEGLRTVVLARTKKGYGFVLRGAKAEQLRKLNVQFVPSERMPALQYLDSVEKGSVADKAGLKAGDFILEIDNKNVVHASHEQTVQIIKKAGDVLAMKVVRAVLAGPELTPSTNGEAMNGSAVNTSLTLPAKPHQKPPRDDIGKSSPEVVMRRSGNTDVHSTNGLPSEEEKLAIEQLDATLANYDSDSRSSGSGAIPNVVIREQQKTASIRHRPTSSHFNSIQELDDMFAPPVSQPIAPPIQAPVLDKNESRKPAKSRVKKFWNKGKSSKLSSGGKQLSLSQPNLAALDPDAEVKPITMYEMSVGHSIDAEGHMSGLPRTFSGDLSTLQRRKSDSTGSSQSGLPPPPPNFPAPPAPDDDRSSQISGHSSASSNRTGSFLHPNSQSKAENRFLPRTPLPSKPTEPLHLSSSFQSTYISTNGGTLQRNKSAAPPPPCRSSSYDTGVILTMQANRPPQSVVTAEVTVNNPPYTALAQSNSFTHPPPPTLTKEPELVSSGSPFSDAIRRRALERENTERSSVIVDAASSSSGATIGNEIYAAVQKRQARTGGEGASDPPPPPTDPKPTQNQGVVSVEDQLRLAVENRRKLIDRREPSTSDSDSRSHSVTPERALSATTDSTSSLVKSESTNFREKAEQRRIEFLKKKADNGKLPPAPLSSSNGPVSSDKSTEDNLTELQKVMSRLSVAKSDSEPNNNTNNKKKAPPPVVMKKPGKAPSITTSNHDHLSPVEEFPPPPPPHEFETDDEIIIPPPTFEMSPPAVFSPSGPTSPPIYPPSTKSDHHHHHHNDVDNHSVTSSVGSDTISSVSQDGNRLSVATSGYSSDPSRTTKLSFSGKNVDLWNTEEVGEWLEAIGLGEYKVVFAENCIEGELLASMSKTDIKELGVEKVGHRVKLDKEIKKLISESAA